MIELRSISKAFASSDGMKTPVLQDVSLTIMPGEFVAFVGQSGSGKSTLMNLLGLLDRPTGGSYLIHGRDVSTFDRDELAALRRGMFGFVFQQYNLIPSMSARENIEMPASYAGFAKEERRQRALTLLNQLGLEGFSEFSPTQLSGGQQQRVSIARALVNGGQVILADEPTGALDSATGIEVVALLRTLADRGHTVILVTHDRDVASSARRIIEIRDGIILSDTLPQSRGGVASTKDIAQSASANGSPVTRTLNDVLEAVRSGSKALRANLFRTILTLLGIMIGVASVVALMAIGEGARKDVLDRMAIYGASRIYIIPGGENSRGPGGRLLAEDVQVVLSANNVKAAIPYQTGRVTIRAGNIDYSTTGVASTVDFPQVQTWPVERGAFFNSEDESRMTAVAVLGAKLAARMFPDGSDPLRRVILVDGVPFQIIGILATKGGDGTGMDNDDSIVFPLKTGQMRIFGKQELTWITLTVADITTAKTTEDGIKQKLQEAHGAEDFRIFNQAAYIDAENKTQDTLKLLLSSTAAISLLVGGIGIMNMMLMTVTERTREIGIRIATGARTQDILLQFLTEATVLAFVGGVAGVALGFAAGSIAAFGFELPVIFTGSALAGALVTAIAMGVIFGFVPALRAARLEPIVALARQ